MPRLDLPRPMTGEDYWQEGPLPTAIRDYPCGRPTRAARCTGRSADGYAWCPDCQANWFACACPCNRILRRTTGRRLPQTRLSDYPGMLVCPTYYNRNVTPCGACQQPTLFRTFRSCSCGLFVCGHCRQTTHTHPQPQIHSYGHKPIPNFLGGGTKLYLGVELEVDNASMDERQLTDLWAMSDNEQLFYLKHDSSLRSGFELVTHPATLDYHRRKFPWGGREKPSVLQVIKDYGYQSHRTTTCGLHVHASKAGLGATDRERDHTLSKLLILFWKHWREIVVFSRRTAPNIDRWARPNHVDAGMDVPMMKKLDDMKVASHSRAINTGPLETIEFRLFRGALERMVILAVLEFVQTMIDLAKNNGASWAYNSSWDDIVAAGSQYLGLSMYFTRLAERQAKQNKEA